ncbi:MAG TPA: hypothetical protein VK116_01500, partial [Planctomycetota bacterium]|nr:hypothetical protein [Planctomycetota bacterium]
VAEGKLTVEERNALIREVADEVCSDVVRDNRLQSDALSLEMARPGMLIHHRWLIAELESTGLLSRALEAIPSERQLDQLAEAGAGLVRSQLAVLLAYAKIDAYARVIESDAPDSPALAPYLDRYFPAVITDRFTEETRRHPLRREIIATAVINDCVNRHGVTFLHRVASEEGRSIGEVLRAWVRANSLVDGDGFFDAIDETHTTGALLPDDAIAARIAFADSVEEIVRWILLNDHQIDLDDERFRAVLLEARAIQTGPSLELEVTLPDPLERALSDAVRMRAALECATLAQRHAVSARVADIVLESAAERLFSFELAQEARRVRVSTIEDEVVRGRLLARLDRLRLRLASAILLGMSDDHQASPEARDRAASIRPSETAVVDIPRRARELVADDHPARRFVAARIARLPTSEPLTPSGLFVLVESLEHLLPR